MTDRSIPLRRKLSAIVAVARYRPTFSLGVVALSGLAAVLEGVGMSFILPIIEHAREADAGDPGGIMGAFVAVYDALGVPFTLEYIVLGVGVVMVARYTSTFLVEWLKSVLAMDYLRHVQQRSFSGALDARIDYFDRRGSDDVLNAIITQPRYVRNIIRHLVQFLELGLVSLVYFGLAVYLAPRLTLLAVGILGGATLLTRRAFGSGISRGGRVAEANERIQEAVQAGTQGIRDVKLYGLEAEIFSRYKAAIDGFYEAMTRQRRDSSGINNFHQLSAALAVFALVYVGIEHASLSIGALGVFLFAVFRLSPKVSQLNDLVYKAETSLPHVVRAQDFIDEIEAEAEERGGAEPPDTVKSVTFDGVSFAYRRGERTLEDVSFSVEEGEFVAFVGESGAGKSTIVAMIARLYDPDKGTIRANGTPIEEFALDGWRDRVALVRQDPYIFSETLRYNLTVADRDASQQEIERVAAIASVDDFVDELPEGYDTELGEDGVRLSGGQKQRVALARALLKDADVLLLDEATSDLDRNTEARVQRAVERMEGDRITITVAHRLSTVKNADRINAIVDGEIVESGGHDELMAQSGEYADLYSESGEGSSTSPGTT